MFIHQGVREQYVNHKFASSFFMSVKQGRSLIREQAMIFSVDLPATISTGSSRTRYQVASDAKGWMLDERYLYFAAN